MQWSHFPHALEAVLLGPIYNALPLLQPVEFGPESDSLTVAEGVGLAESTTMNICFCVSPRFHMNQLASSDEIGQFNKGLFS